MTAGWGGGPAVSRPFPLVAVVSAPWPGSCSAALTLRPYLTHSATGDPGADLPYDGEMGDTAHHSSDTAATGVEVDEVDRVLADKTLLGRSGFASGSELYERARPGYPDDAVAHLLTSLALAPTSRVLDMAAGTGKLTRALVATGASVVASEPSASMRAVFASVLPGTPQVGATAELLPFADSTFDAVTVAQAFHWFDAPVALAECARVLRPGGGLAMVWNERDEEDPVVAELTRVSKWDVHQPYPVGMDFAAVIEASGYFGPVTRTKFRFTQELDRHAFVEQVASRSYIAVLPEDRRQAILADVAALAARLDEPILLPYLVDTFCARAG